MGRPPTSPPKKLKDGFYMEIRNKGSQRGIKIRRESRETLERAIKEYQKTKDVIVLGESKNGKWLDQKK